MWTTLLSCLTERRLPNVRTSIAILLTLTGIILIQKPHFLFQSFYNDIQASEGKRFPYKSAAYAMALANSFFFALFFLSYDVLQRQGVHFSVFQFNFSVVCFVVVLALSLGYETETTRASFDSVTPTTLDGFTTLLGALLIGVFDTLARFCLMFALRHVSAEVVSLFATLEIPLSYICAFFAFGQTPDILGGVGAFMIFTALVIVNCNNLGSLSGDEPQSKETETLVGKDERCSK